MIRHPLENLSPRTQRNGYWLSLVGVVALVGFMHWLIAPSCVKVPGQILPHDILTFELAHTPAYAQQVIDSWGTEGRAAYTRQVLVDYAFLLVYPQAIALGILAVLNNTRNPTLWTVGRALAWLQWLAGALDAVENAALLQTLRGTAVSPWPELAFWCAVPKFLLVIAGVLFILGGVGLAATRARE